MDPLTNTPPRPGSGVWFSRARSHLLHAVGRHNPFYLLSAACMLGGCLLLTNSLSWSPIKFQKLLALLVTINVYELLLLGFGLFLVSRSNWSRAVNARRDSAQLLIFGAVFMTDAAFLCSEVVSSHLGVGVAVSAALFVLALVKVHVASYVFRVRLEMGRLVAVSLILAMLFGLPCILKYIGDTRVHGPHLYVAWWAAALLWGLYHIVARPSLRTSAERAPVPVDVLFVVIPFLSLLTHIGILHYVYNEPFVGPDAAPMLLAFALVLSRLPAPASLEAARARRFLQGALPVVAVLVSVQPRGLAFDLRGVGEIAPVVLASAGAYALWVAMFLPRYLVHFLTGGLAMVAFYAISPPASDYVSFASRAWGVVTLVVGAIGSFFSWLGRTLMALLPTTSFGWGITAITSAFGLLGLGATITMRRVPPAPEPVTLEGT